MKTPIEIASIMDSHKDQLQKALSNQCVTCMNDIVTHPDWWGGIDFEDGHSFDFNVHDSDGNQLRAVAYYCDDIAQGLPVSTFSYDIELEVPQFLKDEYNNQQREQGGSMKTRQQKVKELTEFYLEGYCLDSDWSASVLEHGWTGFRQMTDGEVDHLYNIEIECAEQKHEHQTPDYVPNGAVIIANGTTYIKGGRK